MFTCLRANTPWIYLDIDRVKAKTMGVDIGDVFDTLQVYMGSLYVNNFNEFGRSWQVNVQADAAVPRHASPKSKQLKVRNSAGQMVPLSTLAPSREHQRPGHGRALQHVSRRRRSTATWPPAPVRARRSNHGSGWPTRCCRRAMGYQWTELTYMQILAGSTAMNVFVLAVVLVFLVLAAQYESWSLPLAVILVVPMCLLCSIAGVALVRHGREHLHADRFRRAGGPGQQERDPDRRVRPAAARRGRSNAREATLEACRLRLRPIIMTSLAFILGVVPLVIAEGAGAEMRRTLGTAVFSGMLGVTLFGIFLTPVFFYVIQGVADWRARRAET